MQAPEFWKAVTVDRTDFLERPEPVVTIYLDLAVAVEDLALAESLLRSEFELHEFPDSLNVSAPGSDLRVQIKRDPRYFEFVEAAIPGECKIRSAELANVRRTSQTSLDCSKCVRLFGVRFPPISSRDSSDLSSRSEIRPIERAIMHGFRDMAAVDARRPRQIGDRPRDFQHAIVSACR